MKGLSSDFIRIEDLYLAYRKAKAEAFFDNMHPSAIAFSDYEENLERNLSQLHSELTSKSPTWFKNLSLIGEYMYVPKSLNTSCWDMSSDDVHFRAINPIDDWHLRYRHFKKKPIAKYRLVISATVDYQIISALWILKVGHAFEAQLNKDWSYGNRLRRYRPNKLMDFFLRSGNGDLNLECSGLFSPYFSGYKSWRENGLKAMREAVNEGVSISAVTMDLTSFYHNVSPNFILKTDFFKEIGLIPESDELLFTEQFISSINCWYRSTPDYKTRTEGALPVGLSASKILSNILLYQLDEDMQVGLQPLYYGRYVDDIFLVIESPPKSEKGRDLLKYIAKKTKCLSIEGKNALKVSFSYSNDSNLIFSGDKQKIFSLSSEHGLDFIDQITEQVRKQSSEYRLLPELPNTATEMASKALLATPSASLNADALRKADVVSIRRLGFSLLLKDIECYAKDLDSPEWIETRQEFYGLVHRHLLTPEGIFEFTNYYPRIFSLMIGCGDFEAAHEFIDDVVLCFKVLGDTTNDTSRGQLRRKSCESFFVKVLLQAGVQASTDKRYESYKQLGQVLRKLFKFNSDFKIPSKAPSLKSRAKAILLADLGKRPYKDFWYYSQKKDMEGPDIPSSLAVRKTIRLAAVRKFQNFAHLKQPHWPALAFATRPLTIQEMLVISPELLKDKLIFKKSILGIRGAKIGNKSSLGVKKSSSKDVPSPKCINIPLPKGQKDITIALTSLSTTDEQWSDAARGNSDRSLERYTNLMNLVNLILKEKVRPDYVVFPECSIPRRWAFSMAVKLATNGISLICGLEYYPNKNSSKNKLRNDCFLSLATTWPGYRSSIIYMQPKLEPSHNEKENLKKLGKHQWIPKDGVSGLPVFQHGKFFFGVLICSDLTNIESRNHFKGSLDGLFVLEWNPDISTFNFLVESAAHDLHTFVIQANNRRYGDSRIRAPYKKDYKRDSVQIKGGITDFFVMGKIDFQALRSFQKKPENKEPIFKPLPIGYQMSEDRMENIE